MAKAVCVFSGKEQEDFKGMYLLKNDGSVNYYANSKCMKNHLHLGRDKRKIRWTDSFHQVREKRAEKQAALAEKRKIEKAKRQARRAESRKAKVADTTKKAPANPTKKK